MQNLHMFTTSILRMKFSRSARKAKQKEIKACLGYTNCCPECAKHESTSLVLEPEILQKTPMERLDIQGTTGLSNLQPLEMDLLASIEKEKPTLGTEAKRLQRGHSKAVTPVHQELTKLLRSLSSVVHFQTGETEDDRYGPLAGETNIKRAWGSTRVKEPNGVLIGAGLGHKPVTPRNPRTKQVGVEIRTAFIKIIDVDTLKQRFKADVYIQAKWEEPALRGIAQEDLDRNFHPDDYWNPELFVPNISGHPERDDTWYVTSANEPHHTNPVIFMRRRLKGFFTERMELRDFPLDVQELHVKVASRRKETEIQVAEDINNISVVNTVSFSDSNEFSLYRHVEATTSSMSSRLPQDTRKHPLLEFNVSVRRNTGYFFWNVIFPMFLISGMMFATYGIDRKKYDERIKVNVLLVLSIVALKFVVAKGAPKIPYMTYMDGYVLVSLIVVMMMACQNAILSFYRDNATKAKLFDTGSAWFFLVVYLLVQLICGALLGIAMTNQKVEMNKRDRKYLRRKHTSDRQIHTHRPNDGDFCVMTTT